MSLAELAAAVRARRVSSEELVGEAFERIERLNAALSAVVALRAEEAPGEARALDARIAAGEDPGRSPGCRSWSRTTPTSPGCAR